MNRWFPTRWCVGFCLVAFCYVPVCLRAVSSADDRWMVAVANLLTNPPAVDYLIYSDTYHGKTTYHRILYQGGDFVIKRADSLKNLERAVLTPAISINAKMGDTFWYFDGKLEQLMHVSDVADLRSTNAAIAHNAQMVINHVSMYSREDLNVLLLGSQATPSDPIQLSGREFSLTNQWGAAVSGVLHNGDDPSEVVLEFTNTVRNNRRRFEEIICHFNPNKFSRPFPFLIERNLRFSPTNDFENAETFEIIDFHPVTAAINKDRFEPENGFLAGLSGIWYYQNNQARLHAFDPGAEMRVEVFGHIIRQSTLRHTYLVVCTISAALGALLIFKVTKSKRNENQ